MKYFANLPIISYANNLTRNILARVKISNTPTYYPYTMNDAQKAEHIAYDYYGESDDIWVLNHINEIIDPYFDYSLSQIDFDRFIDKKYGSVYKAQRDIAFYSTNYFQDETILSPSEFNALTPGTNKKYWRADLDINGMPFQYVRSSEDITICTNKIISANISLTTSKSFKVGEKVTQSVSGATAFVAFSNSSLITVQHITGTINLNNITGDDSGAIATVQDVNVINTLIPDTESTYFSPVTYYEYELFLNTTKKSINVLDKSYLESVSAQFRFLVNE